MGYRGWGESGIPLQKPVRRPIKGKTLFVIKNKTWPAGVTPERSLLTQQDSIGNARWRRHLLVSPAIFDACRNSIVYFVP
jgi:hypothetical protein